MSDYYIIIHSWLPAYNIMVWISSMQCPSDVLEVFMVFMLLERHLSCSVFFFFSLCTYIYFGSGTSFCGCHCWWASRWLGCRLLGQEVLSDVQRITHSHWLPSPQLCPLLFGCERFCDHPLHRTVHDRTWDGSICYLYFRE